MSYYLEYHGVTKATVIPSFKTRQIKFDWVHPSPKNEESGIFTMVHMLMYEGQPFKYSDLNSKRTRRFLVVELAASLILADSNQERDEVMEKINQWVSTKETTWIAIQARRRLGKYIIKASK